MSLPLCAGLPCASAAFCGACELGELDTSIDVASTPGPSPSRVSVGFLRRDADAVRDAIELPWSNGQAEGLINRLKTIKRTIGQSGLRTH